MKLRLFLALAVLATARAQEPDDPTTELASFKLPAGFQANLFASEADGVVKPLQMRWDVRGRLWVLCTTTYPQLKPGDEPHDRVLILEDRDGDGRADQTTVFDDQLLIPTGLEVDPDGRGAWVGEGTKLWHLRDNDGDGRADSREVVLRGFGTGDNHQNINSFSWSPAGDLFFCQGMHAFSRVETPRGIVGLDQAGFWRLKPKTGELESFFGGAAEPLNPWGWAWTDWGQGLLAVGNNGQFFYPAPEMVRGHDLQRAGDIWRPGGARKTSGPEIIGNSHFPPEWQGLLLTGGYMNHAIWAFRVEDDGAGFRTVEQPPLVTSTHNSFRPVDVKAGPDGAIYLCDWYNPIIGHYQASFRHPDRDKIHGRIWRITATDRPLVKAPLPADLEIARLLENLLSSDRWTRQQSKRALLAREPELVQRALGEWCARIKGSDQALLEALGVYEALDTPVPELLSRLLKAQTSDARAYAAATVARWGKQLDNPLALLRPLLADENARVRMAAVVALGNLGRLDGLEPALGVGEKPMDRFLDSALHQAVVALKPQWLPALQRGELTLDPARLQLLIKADGTSDTASALRALLTKQNLEPEKRTALAVVLARTGNAEDIAFLLGAPSLDPALLKVLVDSPRTTIPPDAAKLLAPLMANPDALRLAGAWKIAALEGALLDATRDDLPPEVRLAAIDALGRLGGERAKARLIELSDDGDVDFRVAVVTALTKVDLAEAARQAVGNIIAADGTPGAVSALLPAFLARPEGATLLARELRDQTPPPLPALAEAALQKLRELGRQDEELVALLTKFTGRAAGTMNATPELVQSLAREAREDGDAEKGEAIFRRPELACIACHAVGGQGGTIGPSLDSIGTGQPLDFIIGAVLEPQREVKEGYEALEITTRDGRLVQGLRVRESKTELVLRDAATNAEITFLQAQVAARKSIGSLMPAGLLERLSREEQRDLFRYLSGLGKR